LTIFFSEVKNKTARKTKKLQNREAGWQSAPGRWVPTVSLFQENVGKNKSGRTMGARTLREDIAAEKMPGRPGHADPPERLSMVRQYVPIRFDGQRQLLLGLRTYMAASRLPGHATVRK
jgi:hypothetical protein